MVTMYRENECNRDYDTGDDHPGRKKNRKKTGKINTYTSKILSSSMRLNTHVSVVMNACMHVT